MSTYTYLSTSELPSVALRWLERDGTAVDLSAASFSLKFINSSGSTLLNKTSGFTGYASLQGSAPNDYNLVISWSSGQLATTGLPGGIFSTRLGTLVLTYSVGGSDSEPFGVEGPDELVIKVTAAPS